MARATARWRATVWGELLSEFLGTFVLIAFGDGVVDAHLRTFAVPNLYSCDGSVLPTQGSANPALTIMALAARCADHLARR